MENQDSCYLDDLIGLSLITKLGCKIPRNGASEEVCVRASTMHASCLIPGQGSSGFLSVSSCGNTPPRFLSANRVTVLPAVGPGAEDAPGTLRRPRFGQGCKWCPPRFSSVGAMAAAFGGTTLLGGKRGQVGIVPDSRIYNLRSLLRFLLKTALCASLTCADRSSVRGLCLSICGYVRMCI